MKILTQQEVIDILYGCTVLGTGGGGSLAEGLEIMADDFANARPIHLLNVTDIADDAYIATPYGCGAPKQEGDELEDRYKHLPQIEDIPSVVAFKKLEEFLGTKFSAISSTELGGANTAEALHIAALLGLPIMDADPAGRSVPELSHSTYFINNVPIAPMAVATEFGDVVILTDVVDDYRAEEIVRAIAVASNNLVGVVDHPIQATQYRQSVIVGALSHAMKIGQLVREFGAESPHVIAAAESGKVLIEGIITRTSWERTGGFNIGEIQIEGDGSYDQSFCTIWFKNENLIAYKDGDAVVTCPDLICIFDDNGMPVTNPDAVADMHVVVIALPAPEIWKSAAGVECFGPKYFGFDLEYIPI